MQEQRLSASKRGYDKQWYRLRAMKLAANPICEECQAAHRVTPATMVHHIIPIQGKGDPGRLAWDNLMSLCESCHDVKHSNNEENKRLIGCDVNGWPTHPDHPWVCT